MPKELDITINQIIDTLEEKVENRFLKVEDIMALEEIISKARTDLKDEIAEYEKPRKLSLEEQAKLFSILEKRLSETPDYYIRPEGISFPEIKTVLEANPSIMYSLFKMEQTGGGPDIIAVTDNAFVFADFSEESPTDRRCLTYGGAVREAKEFKVDIMDEDTYKMLQRAGKFDSHTQNWLKRTDNVRGTAPVGGYIGKDIYEIIEINAFLPSGYRGWRGVLRVPRF